MRIARPVLTCEGLASGCPAEFDFPADFVTEVRAEAKRSGWAYRKIVVRVSSGLDTRLADLCPEHAEVRYVH